MTFEFSEVGFGISLALILFSIVYTYVIRYLVISKYNKKVSLSALKISKSIFKQKKLEVFYRFTSNNLKNNINVIKKEMYFEEKTFLSKSIYSLSFFTFLTYSYLNMTKTQYYLSVVQRYLSFIMFVVILFLFSFNLWIYALVLFGLSSLFTLFIFIFTHKRVKFSVDSTNEILKYHLDESDYYQSTNIVKKFSFFYLDVFLNSGVSTIFEFAKFFKNWN